jgi:non-specific protein-tyrosine kinase
MGKFADVLKKAEKETVDKPVAPKKYDHAHSNLQPPAPATARPAAKTVQRRVVDPHDEVHVVVDRSEEVPAPATSMPSATVVESPTAREPVEHSKPRMSATDALSPAKASPSSVEAPPVDSSALRDQSELDGEVPMTQDPQSAVSSQRIAPREPQVNRNEAASSAPVARDNKIEVRYSKTKVQVNDPEILRNNRVFSVFDDFEVTDQIKILRTQVLRKLKAIGGNSILITSANPYEGKTFTSINLGISIAKEFDRTVLLIDADVRKPTKHHVSFSNEFFSLKVERGLTDYLEGDADISEILINPGIDKLTLIPGGVPVDNSPELLNSGRMEQMMQEIKSRYPADRIVILDGPAILPYPDAMILARYVDGVIPVIESERTSGQEIKKMMFRLKEVKILGTVLNKNKG